ncbi:SDR family oxidoreductase [Paraburkholderia strydomiana]|uniref:SDR family oxidoreductase n=1 Tax=Paraburkholderia sp. 40 TaxID=2991059 RepID=UPI00103A8F7D|nr:hypothetical protein BZM26_00360 [Paraburkholderia strydomiana]
MTRTVLITGAASGFGENLVHKFAEKGWNVTATMRDINKAPFSFAKLSNVHVTRLDVRDEASIHQALASSEQRFGALDVLVNAAAKVLGGTLEEHTIDQVRDQFETNVFGTLAVTRAVLPGMRARGSGHILNFSSAAGVIAMPLIPAYAASKFAIEGYSESLAFDLAHLGVMVTIVEPGYFETELGSKAEAPAQRIEAYAPAAELRGAIFDYTPGNLDGASEAIVSIAGSKDAPVRLYVGHGLDSVRKRYQEHLDAWKQNESITRSTL